MGDQNYSTTTNKEYESIVVEFDDENNWDENVIWGVVTSAINIF